MTDVGHPSESRPAAIRPAGLLWPTVAMLGALALLLGLGLWQLERRAWKLDLIATIAARTAAAPLPPEVWASLACARVDGRRVGETCAYTPVRLRGRFDHERERHVFWAVGKPVGGVGGAGYLVFTPLRLSGGAGTVLVNRGFVPGARKLPESRPESVGTGEIELVGMVRAATARGPFDGANDPAANVHYVRDPRELLAPTGPQPGPDPLGFYVEQTSAPPAGGLPQPLGARIDLPNRHLEYALTWFGLAATLVAVWAAFIGARWRAARALRGR